MKPIRIGIIGTGNISHVHMNAYKQNPRVELYALCDLNRERVLAAAKAYGVPEERVFTDMREMLKLQELDAVSVCTWNSAHAPCAIAALNAGKHVLCEKPMALNAREAAEMQAAAERAGKLLMIGFVRRFGNDCFTAQDFLDTGYCGEIYYAKAVYQRRNGNPGGWFGDKSRSGGGPLIDLGVHVIDLVRYLMGNPQPVSVYGAAFHKLGSRKELKAARNYVSAEKSDYDVCDVEDSVTALIRFDNGAVLSVETAFCLNMKQDRTSVELFGTKGGARLEPDFELYADMNGHLTDAVLSAEPVLGFDELFQREIDHYISCIADGIPCRAPAEDGAMLMKILDAVYRSAETGNEVKL